MPIFYPKIGPFTKGMDTIQRSETLPEDTARNIVNFDVDDAGKTRIRAGKTQVYSGNIVKDTFWSNGDIALFVEDGDLKRLNDDFTATLIHSSAGYSPMRYVCVDDVVYYTNGVVTGLIRDGSAAPWGVTPPTRQPTLSAGTSSNGLSAGEYQVAVTFISPTGEESGTGLSERVDVGDNGVIHLSDIPQPPEGHTVRVYVSTANGEKLYSRAELIRGQISYDIYEASNVTGRILETQFGIKPPAGHLLEYHNGRIFIANGPVVFVTEPLRYGLVKRSKGFLLYGRDVTMMKSVENGIYIAADKTYFINNYGPDIEQKDALPYGAVPGAAIELPKTQEGLIRVAWWSERGLCIGGPDGMVLNLMEDKVAISKFSRASLLYREQDGLRNIMAVLQGGEASKYAAADYVSAETARRGNAI
jgi:hypothetical protein